MKNELKKLIEKYDSSYKLPESKMKTLSTQQKKQLESLDAVIKFLYSNFKRDLEKLLKEIE